MFSRDVYYKNGKLYKAYREVKNYRDKAFNDKWAGQETGWPHKSGYVGVTIRDKKYLAHRVIWSLHYGDIPEVMQVDHINHIRDDNRIENLRLVFNQENGMNQGMCRSNTSGFNGVSMHSSGRWRARVKHKGIELHLGLFYSASEAAAVVSKKLEELGFHENHGKKTKSG